MDDLKAEKEELVNSFNSLVKVNKHLLLEIEQYKDLLKQSTSSVISYQSLIEEFPSLFFILIL